MENKGLENNIFLINLNTISYEYETLEKLSKNKICMVKSFIENDSSKLVRSFNKKAIEDYVIKLKNQNILVNIFENLTDFNHF